MGASVKGKPNKHGLQRGKSVWQVMVSNTRKWKGHRRTIGGIGAEEATWGGELNNQREDSCTERWGVGATLKEGKKKAAVPYVGGHKKIYCSLEAECPQGGVSQPCGENVKPTQQLKNGQTRGYIMEMGSLNVVVGSISQAGACAKRKKVLKEREDYQESLQP